MSYKNVATEILKSDLSPGSCVICDREDNLKCMHTNYTYKGQNECYADMLLQVFNIKIVGLGEEDTKSDICIRCIYKLRDALEFRKSIQVIDEHYNGNIKYGYIPVTKIDKKIKKTTISRDDRRINDNIDHIENDFLEADVPLKDSSDDDFEWEEDTSYKDNDKSKEFNENNDSSFNKIPPLDTSSTTCPVCNERHHTYRDLRSHYMTHFPHYVCDVCGVGYPNVRYLKVHLESHNTLKFPCTLCSRTYKNLSGLKGHLRVIHRGIKPVVRCKVCGEQFAKVTERNRHEGQAHGLPIRRYACAACDKTFLRSCHRSEHVKRDHLNERNYSCAQCDSKFFCNSSLRDHMLKHTGEKIFNCDTCGKSFVRKKTLKEHLKIHANLRAFKCDLCDKSFVQKCTLKGHMNTHNKKDVNFQREKTSNKKSL